MSLRPLIFVFLLLVVQQLCTAVHIKGTVEHAPGDENEDNNNEHFQLYYLSKFGVAERNSMYVFGQVRFGNKFITLDSQMVLALLPQTVADNLVEVTNQVTCNQLMSTVLNDSILVGNKKCTTGFKDYIRQVPCHPSDRASCNQPNSTNVVGKNDFTYRITNAPETEYYYLFLLSCNRNYSVDCTWGKTDESFLDYNISLVNSDPDKNNINPFVYQFSYDFSGVLVMQLIFTIAYLVLLIIHLLMHTRLCNKLCKVPNNYCGMHRLPALFTVSLCFELVLVVLELMHFSVYASDGIGIVWFKYIGEVANQFSDWLMILVLILIGKGWMITTSALRWKKVTFGLWGAYVLVFSLYFVWTVLQDQVYPLSISTDHPFQSWPGGLYLAYRLFLLLYILYEMRHVYLVENRSEKLKLYVVLAVFYVVWFCYLPFIVFVSAFINPLYKYRVISAFLLAFDYLANIGMVLLFLPRWSRVIFQFDSHLNTLQDGPYKSLKAFHYGSSGTAPNVI